MVWLPSSGSAASFLTSPRLGTFATLYAMCLMAAWMRVTADVHPMGRSQHLAAGSPRASFLTFCANAKNGCQTFSILHRRLQVLRVEDQAGVGVRHHRRELTNVGERVLRPRKDAEGIVHRTQDREALPNIFSATNDLDLRNCPRPIGDCKSSLVGGDILVVDRGEKPSLKSSLDQLEPLVLRCPHLGSPTPIRQVDFRDQERMRVVQLGCQVIRKTGLKVNDRGIAEALRTFSAARSSMRSMTSPQ